MIVLIPVQGKISFHNLKRVAKELGENLTDEELQVSVSPMILLIALVKVCLILMLISIEC